MTKLEADHNKIAKWPQGFDKLVKLNFLNLSKSRLSVFPEEVRSFKKISTLKVASNKTITSIPDWIDVLSNLEMLDLKSICANNFP